MEGKPNFRMQRTLCFWEGDLRRKAPCVRKVHVNSWVVLSWTRMNSRKIFSSLIFATQAAFEKVIFDTWNTLPKICFATSTSILYNHHGVADKIWNWSIFKGDWNKKKLNSIRFMQVVQLRTCIETLERRLEDELRSFLAISDKRLQAELRSG